MSKAAVPQPSAISFRTRDLNRSCTHCSRKGHDNTECFLLHGYPDWWVEQKNSSSSGSSSRGRGGRFSNSSNRGHGRSSTNRALSNNVTTSNSQDPIAQIT